MKLNSMKLNSMKQLWVALLCALALMGGSTRTWAGNIAVKSGEHLAFLGDSITAFGYSNPGGYVRLVILGLEDKLPVVIYLSVTHIGFTLEQWRQLSPVAAKQGQFMRDYLGPELSKELDVVIKRNAGK